METIKARKSETLWYTLLSAIGMVTATLLVDEQFKETAGAFGIIIVILLDKYITARLRFGTTTAIDPIFKPKINKPLSPLDEAFRRDAEELGNDV